MTLRENRVENFPVVKSAFARARQIEMTRKYWFLGELLKETRFSLFSAKYNLRSRKLFRGNLNIHHFAGGFPLEAEMEKEMAGRRGMTERLRGTDL